MTRRANCAACLRAQACCICHWAAAVAHPVEVLILQHRLEVSNVKNSGRLLHLSLPNSRLVVGEAFDPARLQGLLSDKHSILLYPDSPADPALDMPAPPALDLGWLQQPSSLRLVVLDATWRKSRKMLYLNRALQALPRLPLSDTPPSHYLIRKAHAADQLSTLEATCYALAQLAPRAACGQDDQHGLARLIAGFDGFIGQQLALFKRPLPAALRQG